MVCLCCVELFGDCSNRGMSKQYPLTVFLEPPMPVCGRARASGRRQGSWSPDRSRSRSCMSIQLRTTTNNTNYDTTNTHSILNNNDTSHNASHVCVCVLSRVVDNQEQINMPLKTDHPERPTIILGWSLEHPPGILTNSGFLLDGMVSRSGWHRNRGVSVCS